MLLQDVEELLDGTLGEWDTETVNIELKTYYKPFNCKHYSIPIMNKDIFHKELQCLVKIGVLTLVQQSQYGTPVFIIPNE